MDRFLETYCLFRLNCDKIGNLNSNHNSKKIESVIKKLPINQSPGPDAFTGEFYQIFKEDLMPIFLKLFQKLKRKNASELSKFTITLIPKLDRDTTKKKKREREGRERNEAGKRENYRSVSLMDIDVKILRTTLAN